MKSGEVRCVYTGSRELYVTPCSTPRAPDQGTHGSVRLVGRRLGPAEQARRAQASQTESRSSSAQAGAQAQLRPALGLPAERAAQLEARRPIPRQAPQPSRRSAASLLQRKGVGHVAQTSCTRPNEKARPTAAASSCRFVF